MSINQETSNKNENFILEKDNKLYTISINKDKKKEDSIIIQCREKPNIFNCYELNLNLIEFFNLNSIFKICENINDIHSKLLSFFKNNKVNIESIGTNNIKISLIFFNLIGEQKKIELNLNQKQKDSLDIISELFLEINNLIEDVTLLKEENKTLKNNLFKEINILKNENSNLIQKYESLNMSFASFQNGFNKLNIKSDLKISNVDNFKINAIATDSIQEKNKEENENLESKQENQEQNIIVSNLPNSSKIIEEGENSNEIDGNEDFNNLSLNFTKNKLLADDSYYQKDNYNNNFTSFKSRNNQYYLVYVNKESSIILYNLLNEEKDEIQNAHEDPIFFIKHYLDLRYNINKDIIISSSENRCKIWSIDDNLKCIHNIKLNFKGEISSICFFPKINNFSLYVSSKLENESIKYFDFYGIEKKLNDSQDKTNYINIFYDKETSKNYLISCNKSIILSFNVETNELYKLFSGEEADHLCACLFYNGKITELIEGNIKGNIYIYAFNNPKLLAKISIGNNPINELFLWNMKEQFLFCHDNYDFNIINLKEKNVLTKRQYTNECSVQKIKIPESGESLIVQNKLNGKIILWTLNDN